MGLLAIASVCRRRGREWLASAPLAQLRHRPAAHGRRGDERAVPGLPSWFMRVTCDRCGKDRMVNEAHMKQGHMPIRDILKRMRHDGCGGIAGKAELLTGSRARPGGRPTYYNVRSAVREFAVALVAAHWTAAVVKRNLQASELVQPSDSTRKWCAL